MEVDLHVHSTASDGTFSPKEIIEMAIGKNLKAIALTDHDNIDGLKEAQEIANKYNFELINGIEFSCNESGKEVHILGYFLNLDDQLFLSRINELLESRVERNKKIIEKLNKNGIIIKLTDVKKEAKGNILGRVHFANALIKKGYVSSINEAFDKYLAKGALAYIPRVDCSPEVAVRYIKENGGFSSLAHPKFISLDENFTLKLIKKLKSYGLNAIEVEYGNFSYEDRKKYKSWAKKFSLLTTGGSDFHGYNRETIDLGESGISYEYLARIKKYRLDNK